MTFADPGAERQDSVKSGLDSCPEDAALVAIHDAARPLVTPDEIYSVFGDAREHGAAVLGVPVKATVKESGDGARWPDLELLGLVLLLVGGTGGRLKLTAIAGSCASTRRA